MINDFELADDVIRLKPFCLEDFEKHLQGDDIEQIKWLNSGNKSTINSVKSWIKRNQESWEKNGPVFNFAIWTIENEELIGMIEANANSKGVEGIKNGEANISYSLYPNARGKGYMVRAMNLMQVFLRTKGIKRAVIRVAPANTNSLKVPIRCEFSKTGQIVSEKGNILITFTKELK